MKFSKPLPQVDEQDEFSCSSDEEQLHKHDTGFPSKTDPDFSEMSRKELRAYCEKVNYREDAITNEVFNWASHLLTGLVVVGLTIRLIIQSDTIAKKISFSVYAVGNSVMLFGSFFHHLVGLGGFSVRLYRIFRMIDHCGIFVVIAGTFAPLSIVLCGELGFAVFFYLQVIMINSVVLKIITRHTLNENVFNFVYLAMGWSAVLLFKPMLEHSGWKLLVTTLMGGIAYSVGIIFFEKEKPNPIPGWFCSHEIWHCFVSLGVILHYIVMELFIFPYKPQSK